MQPCFSKPYWKEERESMSGKFCLTGLECLVEEEQIIDLFPDERPDGQEEKRRKRMKVLVVIDMQNDFIAGALGTVEAQAIVPKVTDKIRGFEGRILATRDTHEEGYLDTQEGGKSLPVIHCIRNSPGWQIHPEIAALLTEQPVDKPTFGSVGLGQLAVSLSYIPGTYREYYTDRCLHRYLRDIQCTPLKGIHARCSGDRGRILLCRATPDTHRQALEAMKVCQIDIVNE